MLPDWTSWQHVIPAKAGIQRLANVCYVHIEDLYHIMNRQDNWIPAFAGMTCPKTEFANSVICPAYKHNLMTITLWNWYNPPVDQIFKSEGRTPFL